MRLSEAPEPDWTTEPMVYCVWKKENHKISDKSKRLNRKERLKQDKMKTTLQWNQGESTVIILDSSPYLFIPSTPNSNQGLTASPLSSALSLTPLPTYSITYPFVFERRNEWLKKNQLYYLWLLCSIICLTASLPHLSNWVKQLILS